MALFGLNDPQFTGKKVYLALRINPTEMENPRVQIDVSMCFRSEKYENRFVLL